MMKRNPPGFNNLRLMISRIQQSQINDSDQQQQQPEGTAAIDIESSLSTPKGSGIAPSFTRRQLQTLSTTEKESGGDPSTPTRQSSSTNEFLKGTDPPHPESGDILIQLKDPVLSSSVESTKKSSSSYNDYANTPIEWIDRKQPQTSISGGASVPTQPETSTGTEEGDKTSASNTKETEPLESNFVGPSRTIKLTRPIRTNIFPVLLHKMLQLTDEYSNTPYIIQEGFAAGAIINPQEILRWDYHGRSFLICDKKKLIDYLCPLFFPYQTEYPSFQRQLNLYGFRRLKSMKSTASAATSSGAISGRSVGGNSGTPIALRYYHEMFLRTRPDLCYRIGRVQLKKQQSNLSYRSEQNTEAEPNFDDYTPLLVPPPRLSGIATGSFNPPSGDSASLQTIALPMPDQVKSMQLQIPQKPVDSLPTIPTTSHQEAVTVCQETGQKDPTPPMTVKSSPSSESIASSTHWSLNRNVSLLDLPGAGSTSSSGNINRHISSEFMKIRTTSGTPFISYSNNADAISESISLLQQQALQLQQTHLSQVPWPPTLPTMTRSVVQSRQQTSMMMNPSVQQANNPTQSGANLWFQQPHQQSAAATMSLQLQLDQLRQQPEENQCTKLDAFESIPSSTSLKRKRTDSSSSDDNRSINIAERTMFLQSDIAALPLLNTSIETKSADTSRNDLMFTGAQESKEHSRTELNTFPTSINLINLTGAQHPPHHTSLVQTNMSQPLIQATNQSISNYASLSPMQSNSQIHQSTTNQFILYHGTPEQQEQYQQQIQARINLNINNEEALSMFGGRVRSSLSRESLKSSTAEQQTLEASDSETDLFSFLEDVGM